jgi:hypothetical protein
MGSTDLDFLNESKAKRAVAKVAFLFLASKAGVRSAALDQLRNFVVNGSDDRAVRLFYNSDFLEATKLNANHHAVVLASDSKRGLVSAIVVLFGGLTYIVRLADSALVDFGFT